ncbi:hypothetical protein KIW84_075494 [Lathyrus oleraceus]|uniref:Chromo domain-containing protein n=1 Tax=Pisum sativum TaxID=3888 RepID=A0A9D4ZY73_PEA|nr:hypothetical protein KIW84_075494 [Pisum sativum]
MELGGTDMVLGMDWLASLGNIEANFGKLCLMWELGGQKYSIQGDPTLSNQQVSMKGMMRALKGEGMGFYVQTVQMVAAERYAELTEWDETLGKFEEVFHLPKCLPPRREHDHAILLKPNAAIPNLRPYRPVSYMSQTLAAKAQQKSVYERELMAMVIAIQKWRPYLLGKHFKVHTDQKSLKFITEQRVMGEDQQKWLSKLIGYDFEVKYKPGKENSAADSLSRQMQYSHITTVQSEAWNGLEEEVQRDEKLKGIVQALLADPLSQKGFQLKGGRLYYEGRIVVPKGSPRISWILNEFHDTAVGGHSGYLRTYKRISSVVYWEGMRKRIQEAPPVLIRGDTPGSAVDEISKLTMERNLMIKELQEQLLKAQDMMRNQANKHRREVVYEVGDKVFLKIQPYKMKSLAKRLNQKLSPRFYGPYEIVKRVGEVAYQLKLPDDTRVHPVFHVSLLKKAISASAEPQPLPDCMNEDWYLEPVPEKGMDYRRNDQGDWEVLVKWKDLPEFENSWELAERLKEEFPIFFLEVKEVFEGRGIGRYGRQYVRKRKKEKERE